MQVTVHAGLLVIYTKITLLYAIPFPQYMPQGMGNYGPCGMGSYPQMGGGYPMYNGPMNGPMDNQYGSQMYSPDGDDGGHRHYHHGMIRGQRWHAHAGVDDWPMAHNPYGHARFGRHGFHMMQIENSGVRMGGPMVESVDRRHARMSGGVAGRGDERGFGNSASEGKQSDMLGGQPAMPNTNTRLGLALISSNILYSNTMAGLSSRSQSSIAAPASEHVSKLVAKVLSAKPGQAPHLLYHGPTQTDKGQSAKPTTAYSPADWHVFGKILSADTSTARVSMDIAANELPTTTSHVQATPKRSRLSGGLSGKKQGGKQTTEQRGVASFHTPAARKIRGMY